jgi:NAD(P)H-dependent FMN reductase
LQNRPKILAFAGSTRKASWNKQLLKAAIEGAEKAGADVTVVDLADYPMPFYDADFEAAEGVPDNARAFRKLMSQHDGFLIACPEYNGSVSAVLKNTIDWCSRPVDDEDGLAAYRGKTAALVGTSIGPYGAVRAIGHLRAILSKVGTSVLADEATVPNAKDVFEPDGTLKIPALDQLARKIGANLAQAVAAWEGVRV